MNENLSINETNAGDADPNSFVVRQSSSLNMMLGIFFVVILIGFLFTINGKHDFDMAEYVKPLALVLASVIVFLVSAGQKKLILRFDVTGIYFGNKFITSWSNLISAVIEEDDPDRGYDVVFVLNVQYYATEDGKPYLVWLSLPPTADKSVEEINAAIDEFVQKRNAVTLNS